MAAIPVRITGSITTKAPKGGTPDPSGKESCVIVGLASIEGLEIGGGPIVPPEGGGGGGDKPPVFPGRPTFPIWGPPGVNWPDKPGYPPSVGGGPIIPPELPPDEKPPDFQPVQNWDAKVLWTEEQGWFVILVPTSGATIPTPSK